MRALLVHSPLVGPASMRPLADALNDLGWHTAVADPRTFSGDGDALSWSRWPAAVSDEFTANGDPRGDATDLVLIGHSASCLLLPRLAGPCNAKRVVFIDGRLPPVRGEVAPVDPEFRVFVEEVAARNPGGTMPKWSRWWGEGAMDAILGDAAAEFEADLPRLRLEWFDETIAVPPWTALSTGYIQLSEVFEREAETARTRGIETLHVPGTHVELMTDPAGVAAAVVTLTLSDR